MYKAHNQKKEWNKTNDKKKKWNKANTSDKDVQSKNQKKNEIKQIIKEKRKYQILIFGDVQFAKNISDEKFAELFNLSTKICQITICQHFLHFYIISS